LEAAVSANELAKRIAKALYDADIIDDWGLGTKEHPRYAPLDEAADIITKELAPLVEVLHQYRRFIPCLVNAGYAEEFIDKCESKLDAALAQLSGGTDAK
jgi:hypothetical protein